MSDKYRKPWSDAVHNALRLTRAYDICSSIRQVFADDITYRISHYFVLFELKLRNFQKANILILSNDILILSNENLGHFCFFFSKST